METYRLEMQLFDGGQWQHTATFEASNQQHADRVAFRWMEYQGVDVRSARAVPAPDNTFEIDGFMEAFR